MYSVSIKITFRLQLKVFELVLIVTVTNLLIDFYREFHSTTRIRERTSHHHKIDNQISASTLRLIQVRMPISYKMLRRGNINSNMRWLSKSTIMLSNNNNTMRPCNNKCNSNNTKMDSKTKWEKVKNNLMLTDMLLISWKRPVNKVKLMAKRKKNMVKKRKTDNGNTLHK